MRRRTPAQKILHQSTARFNVACFGRQSGKTTFGIDKMSYKPLQGIFGGKYWFILQTYSAAEVAFERLCRQLHNTDLIRRKPHESDLTVFLQNASDVYFKSGDKPNNLRAETLSGCIIDECREQDPVLWRQIILPMLARHNGWCDFLSSANGFDWFYDLHELARTNNPLNEWASFRSPSTDCWWWTEDQIAQAKANMSEAEFAQEILAEFRDLTKGKAYVSFSDANIKDQNPFAPQGRDYSPYLPIVLAPDFNLNPMSWGIGQLKPHENLWYWADEIRLESSHTQEAALSFVSWYKDNCPGGWGPGLIICGDATSKAGQRAAAGQSDYDILETILKTNGIRFVNSTPDSNPMVKDRVNTMNTFFRNAEGQSKLWIHPRCKYMTKDFQRVTWKENSNNTLDEGSSHELTHSSDGPGYAVSQLTPLKGVSEVGVLRVRRR